MIDAASSPALLRAIVVISDFADGWPPAADFSHREHWRREWLDGRRGPAPGISAEALAGRDTLPVRGGYIERLPLAAIRAGWVDYAEVWHHWRPDTLPPVWSDSPHFRRRAFRLADPQAPLHSEDMLGFIEAFGAPRILCVWGLGISEAILEACRDSLIIYNSIDAPALRVSPEVSRHFDLVLTGAEWQSQAVHDRHPDARTLILPIGPDFASPDTFFPTGGEKLYDVVYVAAAQPYKRHDILFEALSRAPRPLRALCVIGYGELGEGLRQEAAARGLDVTFVGPPGVPHDEVNRLINQARVGVVCGFDDGAPAILTEYMLAGLPVVANAGLVCGLQYILPETGIAVPAERFADGIIEALNRLSEFSPRQAVLDRWSWPHSIKKLGDALNLDRVAPAVDS